MAWQAVMCLPDVVDRLHKFETEMWADYYKLPDNLRIDRQTCSNAGAGWVMVNDTTATTEVVFSKKNIWIPTKFAIWSPASPKQAKLSWMVDVAGAHFLAGFSGQQCESMPLANFGMEPACETSAAVSSGTPMASSLLLENPTFCARPNRPWWCS